MRCNTDSQLHKRKVQLEERGRYSPASPRGIPTAIKPNGPTTETFYHKSCTGALRFSSQALTLFLYAALTSFACTVSQLRLAKGSPSSSSPMSTISVNQVKSRKISNELLTFMFLHV